MAQANSTEADRPSARDRKFEILIGLLLVAIAIGAIVVSQGFPSSGLATDVGPARFPVIYASILIVLCLILIIRNMAGLARHDYDPDAPPLSGRAFILVATGVVATFIQFLALPYIGYWLSMIIYLCFVMALMGMRHRLWNPVLSVVMTGALYVAFDYLLNVPLPVGELFE